MQRIARELMPRVYTTVLNACHRGGKITVVVGPEIWAEILRASDLYHGMTAQDLIRNKIALPKVMGVPIIDGADLKPRGIVVRAEVSV
jgi:hypothetical protein